MIWASCRPIILMLFFLSYKILSYCLLFNRSNSFPQYISKKDKVALRWENLNYFREKKYISQVSKNILSSKGIKSNNTLFNVSVHCISFTWTCLSIGKTSNFRSLKCWIYKGLNRASINLSIESTVLLH